MVLLTTAAVAETREERLAVAKEYTENTIADMNISHVIRTMWEPVMPAIGVTPTKEQAEQIQILYMDTFEQPMIDILYGQTEIMADLFTLKELEALRNFYATPLGASITQKLPKVMEQINPIIISMVQEAMPTVMPKMMEILQ